MPVRIRKLSGGAQSCGGEEMVSGGMDQSHDGESGDEQDSLDFDGLAAEVVSDLLVDRSSGQQSSEKQGSGQQGSEKQGSARQASGKQGSSKQAGGASGGAERVKTKTSEIISELHQAKQELAAELEANLKQLKSVLQETQKIAKEMEAVLKEAKAEPEPEQKAMGGRGGSKEKGAWQPPTMKRGGSKSGEAWNPPKDAIKVYED